jgi:hypothetical protein
MQVLGYASRYVLSYHSVDICFSTSSIVDTLPSKTSEYSIVAQVILADHHYSPSLSLFATSQVLIVVSPSFLAVQGMSLMDSWSPTLNEPFFLIFQTT